MSEFTCSTESLFAAAIKTASTAAPVTHHVDSRITWRKTMELTEKTSAALDAISAEVADIMRRAGVKQSLAYRCGDEAAKAVENVLNPPVE